MTGSRASWPPWNCPISTAAPRMHTASDGKGKSAFSSVFSYIARTLGTKPFAVMAELSYGLYLVHFFVINTWSRLTAPDAILAHMGGPAYAFIVIPIISYLLAWIARHAIELRGIEFGRRFIHRSPLVVSP